MDNLVPDICLGCFFIELPHRALRSLVESSAVASMSRWSQVMLSMSLHKASADNGVVGGGRR